MALLALTPNLQAGEGPVAQPAWSQIPDCLAYGARAIFLAVGGTCLQGIGPAPVSLQAQNPLFGVSPALPYPGGTPPLAEGNVSAGFQISGLQVPMLAFGPKFAFRLGLQPSPAGDAKDPAEKSAWAVVQPVEIPQIPAAAHQLHVSHFESGPLAPIAPFAPAAGFLPSIDKSYGPEAQGSMPLNVDYLSPSDKLWLQAAYEKTANADDSGGKPAAPAPSSQELPLKLQARAEAALASWNPQIYPACAFAGGGKCERWGLGTAGCKNYWLPFVSSALFGSSLDACGMANTLGALGSVAGDHNLAEKPAEAGLARAPVKGFDIGAEYMYARLSQARPDNPAHDAFFAGHGLPAFSANPPFYGGHLRVQGAF